MNLNIPFKFNWNLNEVSIEDNFNEEISENFFISDYIFSFHTVQTLYAWNNFKKNNHLEIPLKDLKDLVRQSLEIDEKMAFLSRQFRWVYSRLKEFKVTWGEIYEYRNGEGERPLFLRTINDDYEYHGRIPTLKEIREDDPKLYHHLVHLRDVLYKPEDEEIYKILGEDPVRWKSKHDPKLCWTSFPKKLMSVKNDLEKIARRFNDSFDDLIEAQKKFFKKGIISLLKNVNFTTYNNVKDNFNSIQNILKNNYFSSACKKPKKVACVAVLLNSNGTFFALNGIDIDPSTINNNRLIPDQTLINLGQQLENYSKIKYVQLSLQTLRYVNLNANGTCDFLHPMQPVSLSVDLNNNSVKKENFTCCERKLSPYFTWNNKIYVSYLPCKRCLPALAYSLLHRVITYAITKKPGFYQQEKVEVRLVVQKGAAEDFKLTEKYRIF